MKSNHPLVIANWKMNTTLADAHVMIQELKRAVEDIHHVQVVVAPPSVWLYPMAEIVKHHPISNLHLAVQDIHQKELGPYTGGISALMVKRLVSYALIGHSETIARGQLPEIINEKIKRALDNAITPVVFLGEAKQGELKETISKLLPIYLDRITKKDSENIIFVYEPAWAISSEKGENPASGYDVEVAISLIRGFVGEQTKVLYGGSVNAKTIHEFSRVPGINGVVVGSASLKTKEFLAVVRAVAGS